MEGRPAMEWNDGGREGGMVGGSWCSSNWLGCLGCLRCQAWLLVCLPDSSTTGYLFFLCCLWTRRDQSQSQSHYSSRARRWCRRRRPKACLPTYSMWVGEPWYVVSRLLPLPYPVLSGLRRRCCKACICVTRMKQGTRRVAERFSQAGVMVSRVGFLGICVCAGMGTID